MTTTADTPASPNTPPPAPAPTSTSTLTDADRAELHRVVDGLRADERTRAAAVRSSLDYIADTRELRTPIERLLADEVHALHRDAEVSSSEYAWLLTRAHIVLDYWRDDSPHTWTCRKRDRLRAAVRGHGFDGSRLADELSKLAAHLGRSV